MPRHTSNLRIPEKIKNRFLWMRMAYLILSIARVQTLWAVWPGNRDLGTSRFSCVQCCSAEIISYWSS